MSAVFFFAGDGNVTTIYDVFYSVIYKNHISKVANVFELVVATSLLT